MAPPFEVGRAAILNTIPKRPCPLVRTDRRYRIADHPNIELDRKKFLRL